MAFTKWKRIPYKFQSWFGQLKTRRKMDDSFFFCYYFLFLLFAIMNQVLIWTLYASNIRTHSLFRKVIKNLFDLKSSKNTFEQGYPGRLLSFWDSEVSFSKISALFIPVNVTIIYSFLLVLITSLPWQIIMQTLKLFTVNGYYMISHWKIKQIRSSVHLFWTFS